MTRRYIQIRTKNLKSIIVSNNGRTLYSKMYCSNNNVIFMPDTLKGNIIAQRFPFFHFEESETE